MISATFMMLIMLHPNTHDQPEPPRCKEAEGLAHGKKTKFILVRVPFKNKHGQEFWMREDAANQFVDLIEMAISHGYEIKLNSAYRTYQHQLRLWKRMPPGIAGHPKKGGARTHQTGFSIDIAGTVREWKGEERNTLLYWFLKRFAKKFQFHNDVPTEPWHWTYVGPINQETRMCSKLRNRNTKISRGDNVTVQMSDGSRHEGRWTGVAREEVLDSTWKDCGKKCVILVDAFTEQNRTFKLPNEYGLEGLILNESGEVLVITRKSNTSAERLIHFRHPKVVLTRRKTMMRSKQG